jgi:hypothetical protein
MRRAVALGLAALVLACAGCLGARRTAPETLTCNSTDQGTLSQAGRRAPAHFDHLRLLQTQYPDEDEDE